MSEYTLHGVSTIDVVVALRCEADRAEREGFPGVAERQRDLALHLENAEFHLNELVPRGYRLQMDVSFRYVAAVNPALKPEYRRPIRARIGEAVEL